MDENSNIDDISYSEASTSFNLRPSLTSLGKRSQREPKTLTSFSLSPFFNEQSQNELETLSSNSSFSKKSQKKSELPKKVTGRPPKVVWNFIIKGQPKDRGHYEARCSFCAKKWAREKPSNLEEHL